MPPLSPRCTVGLIDSGPPINAERVRLFETDVGKRHSARPSPGVGTPLGRSSESLMANSTSQTDFLGSRR